MYTKIFTIRLNKEKCEQIIESLQNLSCIHMTYSLSAENSDYKILGKHSSSRKLFEIS